MSRMKRYRGIDGIPDFLWPSLKAKYVVRYFMWREACHMVGSFALLGMALLAAAMTRLPITIAVFVMLALWMAYQEFYLHPRRYNQKFLKGFLDWTAWTLPFFLYFIVS